ncbi:neuronal acetylcholine receptor subunit alpha-3-like [Lineus longissimus]|uniref:neuronal acetylcholine receptor subunit alpha-3-like n=1 Tax=Lineus longissimus TaxID=88925 RepID=UPI00315D13EF
MEILFLLIWIFGSYTTHVNSITVPTAASTTYTTNSEEQLYTALTGNYGERVRPLADSSQPINISITFNLVKIVQMNEPMQQLQIAGALCLSWTDYKLEWIPRNYNFLTYISLPTTQIWIPDIGQSDSLVGDYDLAVVQDYYNVMVHFSGYVSWMPGGTFTTACAFDITYFPFDTQTCSFTFKSWTQLSTTIQLVASSATAMTNRYTTDGQWKLNSATTEIKTVDIGTSPDGSTLSTISMVLTMSLTRKHTYYMVNTVAPCVLISVLVLVVFYIPPDAGEKISFGITILLAFSVFQLIVADSLPKSSEHTAVLSIYLIFLMAMSTFSVIMSVFILNAHHMCIGEERLPRWAQKLLFGCLAKITCFTGDVKDFYSESENLVVPLNAECTSTVQTSGVGDDISAFNITDVDSHHSRGVNSFESRGSKGFRGEGKMTLWLTGQIMSGQGLNDTVIMQIMEASCLMQAARLVIATTRP